MVLGELIHVLGLCDVDMELCVISSLQLLLLTSCAAAINGPDSLECVRE